MKKINDKHLENFIYFLLAMSLIALGYLLHGVVRVKPEYLSPFGTIILAGLACLAFNQWKKVEVSKKKSEIADRLHTTLHNLKVKCLEYQSFLEQDDLGDRTINEIDSRISSLDKGYDEFISKELFRFIKIFDQEYYDRISEVLYYYQRVSMCPSFPGDDNYNHLVKMLIQYTDKLQDYLLPYILHERK
ncbi:hypothetical protein [Idiomarina piscisalsi]|uniref:Uncharacterized protein n=1 Tax=Idiomarina piscisalsi TaxID=1096243 RepID=A0A432YXD8_9GAMM|nr:hypothetical protein [Idiomarina piscisalsi]RUO67988.1 hypothetical protein CWI73_03790 [Idiomarina piscisalsi]